MSKPSVNIVSCNGKQSLFERLDQIWKRSGFDAAQDRLDLRPSQFNGVAVRRVRWQINQMCATRVDQLFQPSDLVSGEIIHEQDITRLEGCDDTLLDIAIKHRAID